MRPAVAVQAVRPTAVALPWVPVLAVGTVMVGAAVLVDALSDRPAELATLGAAALASGSVAALHDRADLLLDPLPTSRLARRLLRLGLVTVVVVPLVVLLDRLSPAPGDVWATALALTLTGLAVATWLPPERGVWVAAAVPLVWVVATRFLGESAGSLDVWAEHPLPLAVVAAAVVVIGRHR